MTLNDLKKEIRCHADPRRAAVLRRFFKTGRGEYAEGDKFLGLTVPQIRKIVGRFRALKMAPVIRLLHSRVHEDRLTALLILIEQYRRGGVAEKRRIYSAYLKNSRFINNWDLVDLSAPYLAGHYLSGRDKRPLYCLARSGVLWERRISMVACFHFIRQGEFDDALKIAEMLLPDEHDLIHKAVGWMLREIGKRDSDREEGFLKRHGRKMSRTTLRYAIEKFPHAKRRAYLEGGFF